MSDVAKSESVTLTGRLEPRRTINEKFSLFDVVFCFEFGEKHLCDRVCSPWIEANMEHVVCFGIDGGVQPELLVVDSNHCLV